MEMSEKMKILQPRLKKLQEKYANNQEKLAQEQLKLYKEVGYNPLGCFSNTFIQGAILIVIVTTINVITEPDFIQNLEGIYPFVENFAGGIDKINPYFLGIPLNENFKDLIDDCNCIPLAGEVEGTGLLNVVSNYLRNLAHSVLIYVMGPFKVPQSIPYMVLSLMVGGVQYFTTNFIRYVQGQEDPKDKAKDKKKKKDPEELSPEEMQAQMMKSMTMLMPAFTVFIALKAPAVLGIYWLAQSVMTFVQYVIIDKEKFVNYFKEVLPETFSKNENNPKKSKSKANKK